MTAKAIYLLWFVITPYFVYCQKSDYNWVIGTVPSVGNASAILSFTGGNLVADSIVTTMPNILTNCSISDEFGNLLFYSNGIWIANKDNDTMTNGYWITAGFGAEYYELTGSWIFQGALILPIPYHSYEYYIFAVTSDDSISYRPLRLTYSKIDMTLDNGLGAVTEKNVSIIEDTLTLGRITAVKHSDGERWWLISHETRTNKYYKWLVGPDGIDGPYSQKIGSAYGIGFTDLSGQSCFSPDGTKFATFGNNFKLDVMNFDRCTGEFSNTQTFSFAPDYAFYGIATGCSFSPNGRFIYAGSQLRLWQFDLQELPQNAIDTVGFFDGYLAPFSALFGLQQLAPDDNIYIGAWNGDTVMHVIHNPNEKGVACNFTQHGLHLPVYNGTLPNLANYNLGATRIFQADAGIDTSIYPGNSVMLGIPLIDSISYLWSPGILFSDSLSPQPTVYPDTTTTYFLTIVDTTVATGCISRLDSVTVNVMDTSFSTISFVESCNIRISNLIRLGSTFSNVLQVNPSSEEISIIVFNVYGEVVLTSSNYRNSWSPDVSGIYFYSVKCRNGTMKAGKVLVIK